MPRDDRAVPAPSSPVLTTVPRHEGGALGRNLTGNLAIPPMGSRWRCQQSLGCSGEPGLWDNLGEPVVGVWVVLADMEKQGCGRGTLAWG